MFKIFKPKVTDDQVREVVKPMLAEMEKRVNWLQSMQKLDVKDGDIVVLRCRQKLSTETYKHLKAALQEIIKGFGFDVHVMLLEDGMEIGAVRKEDL
ncbi:MAG: hypothetical protein WC261_12235 [Synergistaceae bacterium]|jgi:hypothetical protein